MISKDKFYTHDEKLKWFNKIKMWRRIQKEMKKDQSKSFASLDIKSFLFGSAFTFAVIMLAVVLIRFVPELINRNQADDVKIARAYNLAVAELEKSLPRVISSINKDDGNKELLYANLGELKDIDKAIARFKSENDEHDFSPLKQERLLRFYQLKIEVINKIIMMKGDSWS
jgi:hypothetical protein